MGEKKSYEKKLIYGKELTLLGEKADKDMTAEIEMRMEGKTKECIDDIFSGGFGRLGGGKEGDPITDLIFYLKRVPKEHDVVKTVVKKLGSALEKIAQVSLEEIQNYNVKNVDEYNFFDEASCTLEILGSIEIDEFFGMVKKAAYNLSEQYEKYLAQLKKLELDNKKNSESKDLEYRLTRLFDAATHVMRKYEKSHPNEVMAFGDFLYEKDLINPAVKYYVHLTNGYEKSIEKFVEAKNKGKEIEWEDLFFKGIIWLLSTKGFCKEDFLKYLNRVNDEQERNKLMKLMKEEVDSV